VATLALIIAVGGASAFAATQLAKNSVGSKQLKKNAVTTAKVKNEAITAAKIKKGTLTGTQINPSTLGKVPNATHADTATGADKAGDAEKLGGAPSNDYAKRQQEAAHLVGEPGEPKFENGAYNSSNETAPTGFYKDSLGYVHLQGTVNVPSGKEVFTLPPGFRPSGLVCYAIPAFVGLAYKTNRGCVKEDGRVFNDRGEGTEYVSFDGFSFRAEP
jgi:hypothetical protein